MKNTNWKSVGSLLLLLGLGGALWVGCGNNAADTDADASAAAEPADSQGGVVEPEVDLAEQQRELDRKRAELEAREAEVARRETASKRSTTSTRSGSTSGTTAKRAPEPVRTEPVSRTVNVTLPASTPLEIEFAEGLSSEESAVGDPVRAFVVQDVVQDGLVVVPAGTEVRGQVVEVNPAKKIGGQARLSMGFDTLRLPSGETVPIQSSLELAGKKQAGKDAATIGGSTAGGAILGRVLGGDNKDKATAIGAVVGAAVGTAVAANNKTDPVLVQTGQATQVLLYQPVTMTVSRDAVASVAQR